LEQCSCKAGEIWQVYFKLQIRKSAPLLIWEKWGFLMTTQAARRWTGVSAPHDPGLMSFLQSETPAKQESPLSRAIFDYCRAGYCAQGIAGEIS
jgi:hypothetical protein